MLETSPLQIMFRRQELLPSDDSSSRHQETPIIADPQRLQALFGDGAYRGLRGVQVTVEHDRVLLSGTVSSYYLKQMAQERVRQACPDAKLSNDVIVQT